MALRYIVPALAAIGTAAAASCSGTTTISNAADASNLATCQTYSGSIAIATSNSDDIALDGVRRITGSLTAANNNKMASLSGDSLSQIDDSFTLNNIQLLSTLNFPMLTAVDTVDWKGLPNLGGLSFTAGLQQVGTLSIQNTILGTLDGIDLVEVDTLFVVNNFYLNDITMQLGNVSTALTLSANGDNVQASFPNLIWATNMSLSDCSSIDVQSLSTVNGSLGFYSGTYDSLSAPNLTTVGGTLAFVDNSKLSNVSAPSVRQIGGGLVVANNTQLMTIDGFPRLQQIGGAIDMTGDFKSVSLPALSNVRGAFNLQSSGSIQSTCNHFSPLHGGRANVIKGPFTCKSTNNPTGLHGSGSGSGTSGSSTTSSAAANPLYISGATGVMGVVAAIFGML